MLVFGDDDRCGRRAERRKRGDSMVSVSQENPPFGIAHQQDSPDVVCSIFSFDVSSLVNGADEAGQPLELQLTLLVRKRTGEHGAVFWPEL